MSLLWCDDFASYGTGHPASANLMLNGPYAEVGNYIHGTFVTGDPDPLVPGGVCLACNTGVSSSNEVFGNNNVLRKVLPANRSTVGAAVRLWMNTLPANTQMSALPLAFRDQANNILVTLWVMPTGAIHVNRNSGNYTGAPIAETVGPVILANVWQHIEVRAHFSATVGTVEVRVDSVTVINATNLDTVGTANPAGCAAVSQLYRSQGGLAPTWFIKDYIVWDTAGAVNNDFFGTVRVIRLPVDGDVALNWAPSTGSTGASLIDESPPVDSDYISAALPAPAACVMTFADLPPDITSVRALMTFVRASNSDGGDGKLQTSLVSNGNSDDGADRQITVAETYWSDISETSPDTGLAWTPAETDAARITFNRTL